MSTLSRIIFDPDTTAPSVPTGLAVTALSTTTLRVTWNASTDTGGSGLAGYRVYRSTTSGGTYTQVGGDLSTSSLSYDDTTLSSATTRFYKVAAFDGNGNQSAQSSAASGTTQGTVGTLTAAIEAGRLSGPAPLFVYFSALGTTRTGYDELARMRSIGYSFSFGDPGSGTWANDGGSKNVHRGGPQAAHVFETPGTYVVKMRALDATGNTSQAQVTITAEDPDVVYSGSNTICLSRTSDHAGSPAGATLLSNVTSFPSWASNKRYLFHRGQDFSSIGTALIIQSDGRGVKDSQFGTYGTGAKPIFGNFTIRGQGNAFLSTALTEQARRIVVMDLQCNSTLSMDRGITHSLMFRNSLPASGAQLGMHIGSWDFYADGRAGPVSNYPMCVGNGIVENDIDRNFYDPPSTNRMALSGWFFQAAVMGNSFARSPEHNNRLWNTGYFVIAHNSYDGRAIDDIRQCIKQMSGGSLELPSNFVHPSGSPAYRSKYIQVSNNNIGSSSSNMQFFTSFTHQSCSAGPGELVEKVIEENNTFQHGANWVKDVNFAGPMQIGRGGINVNSGGAPVRSTAAVDVPCMPSAWLEDIYFNDPVPATQDPV